MGKGYFKRLTVKAGLIGPKRRKKLISLLFKNVTKKKLQFSILLYLVSELMQLKISEVFYHG